jgi:hypothetical protein
MRTDELEPDPPPRTGFHGSRFWWVTSALSVFSSTSFVVTQLLPAPDSLEVIRWFVLGLFIVGLLTGILGAMILMMSGFLVAGTARIAGRRIADHDLAYCYLVCYLVPVIVLAWSVFRKQGVL